MSPTLSRKGWDPDFRVPARLPLFANSEKIKLHLWLDSEVLFYSLR